MANKDVMIDPDRDGPALTISLRDWDHNGRWIEYFYTVLTPTVMAAVKAAGLYIPLTKPQTFGPTAAGLIAPLTMGLSVLRHSPLPVNSWGVEIGIVESLQGFINTCKAMPDSAVRVTKYYSKGRLEEHKPTWRDTVLDPEKIPWKGDKHGT